MTLIFIDDGGRALSWTGDFTGDRRTDLVACYPSSHQWRLRSYDGASLNARAIGSTAGFGSAPEGCPTWAGNFSRADRAEVLFFYPGDKNWWLGSHNGNELAWSLACNTAGFGDVPLNQAP